MNDSQVSTLEEPEALVAPAPQSVTVSGTLVDNTNKTWNNANVVVYFVPGFGIPAKRYTWGGNPVNQIITNVATGTGTFSVSIPSNDTILPIDSAWRFVISGDPASPAAVFVLVVNFSDGATKDISALFKSVAPPLDPQSTVGSDPVLENSVKAILDGNLNCA